MMAIHYSENHPFPLSMADQGKPVKVVLLKGGKSIDKRLSTLGLNIDSILKIVHRQGNSLVIGRDHSRFALGTGTAGKIMVVPV